MNVTTHLKVALHILKVITGVGGGRAEDVGEWVEYVDSFGRTRKCPKEDLPHMMAAERRRERGKERERR